MSVNTGSEALVTVAVLLSVSQLSALRLDQVLGHCPAGSPHEIVVDWLQVFWFRGILIQIITGNHLCFGRIERVLRPAWVLISLRRTP